MERGEYCAALLERHRKMMREVDRDAPPLLLRTRLVSEESTGSGFEAVFAVVSTSRAAKLATLVEQRVFAGAFSGVVLDAYDNKIVVSAARRTGPGTLEMLIHANHNNEALLKAAEEFAGSGKDVHPHLLGAPGRSTRDGAACASLSLFNPGLNAGQREAVAFSGRGVPFKILGPPGTGKTETIVEIISQRLGEGKTVLVCGPSNVSVDNIILRFAASRYNALHSVSFYRRGSAAKGLCHLNLEHRANEAVSFMDGRGARAQGPGEAALYRRDRAERRREFIKSLRSESPLVFCTLFSSLREDLGFDVCIVDEACQAAELECFMGVVRARTFVLVGDPNQLCPRARSLYEAAELETVVLSEQYRMPGAMIEFSNSRFYGGTIVSRREDGFLFLGESSMLLVDTSFFAYEESAHGVSRLNTGEALLIRDVVGWVQGLCAGGAQDTPCTIGVITPYSAQAALVRDMVGGAPGCTVDTVDGFQGQERDFIVLSLVRSSSELEVGFLRDRKRMNVALTRCRRGLVVVCDVGNFRRDPFFRDLFGHLGRSACVLDPETFRQLCRKQ